MYFEIPQGEDATYHELAGNMLNMKEIKGIIQNKDLQCFVHDQIMNMIVSVQYSSDVYRLLLSEQCTLGLPGIPIYRIVKPIHVNDVEGKQHYQFISKLQLIENPGVDTNA